MRPMFATFVPQTSVTWVSKASVDSGVIAKYGLKKRIEIVKGNRTVRKKDMKFNDVKPKVRCTSMMCFRLLTGPQMKVDAERYHVHADDMLCTAEPSDVLPLTQAYFVF